MAPETGESAAAQAVSTGESPRLVQGSEVTAQAPEAEVPMQPVPQQAQGRRTQLRIIRENIESLSRDVGSFRKSQEASARKLKKRNRRIEKQVASLRNELAAFKNQIAKDATKSRKRQDASLAKILAKVSARPKPTKGSKPAKRSKKSRSA